MEVPKPEPYRHEREPDHQQATGTTQLKSRRSPVEHKSACDVIGETRISKAGIWDYTGSSGILRADGGVAALDANVDSHRQTGVWAHGIPFSRCQPARATSSTPLHPSLRLVRRRSRASVEERKCKRRLVVPTNQERENCAIINKILDVGWYRKGRYVP